MNREKFKKKKKKVARHLISFDDNDSALSTSIPSSSSSTASDSVSLSEDKSSQDQIEECKKMEKDQRKDVTPKSRKLSMENSGSRDKYPTTVPETLTPVSHDNIGELTPVSVELNKNFSMLDTSDDILEVPMDISALLTAVENKNREEVLKQEEKIRLLVRENEGLKDQVKKYVGAIQMLNMDDASIDDTLEKIGAQKLPNYRDEAKLFEKKLIQV